MLQATLENNLQLCHFQIPEDLYTTVLQSPHSSMELMYALCTCHCLMLCWQCYGWHGSTRRYALTDSVLAQAMTYIVTGIFIYINIDTLFSSRDCISVSEMTKTHCVTLIKNLYSNIITCQQDKVSMNLSFGNSRTSKV